MPSLDDLKKRIGSVKSTQKITKAMKMVAAAKLRRAQDSAESGRPYSDTMNDVIRSVSKKVTSTSSDRNLLSGTGDNQIQLLILFTSERGLCGGFNSSITKKIREKIEELLSLNKTVKVICVGKKGYDILKRKYSNHIVDVIDMKTIKSISYQDAKNISQKIIKMFFNNEFDSCLIFYNKFKSVIDQIPTEHVILPIHNYGNANADEGLSTSMLDFEPSESDILDELLPLNFAIQIFKALLESAASEQGARMSAMDNASRNASDMIDKLTLFYNRSRQAVITKELIEIISGAEAV